MTSRGVGEESVVVLATPEPPYALRAILEAGADPTRVADMLGGRLAARMDIQAGIASLITKRKVP